MWKSEAILLSCMWPKLDVFFYLLSLPGFSCRSSQFYQTLTSKLTGSCKTDTLALYGSCIRISLQCIDGGLDMNSQACKSVGLLLFSWCHTACMYSSDSESSTGMCVGTHAAALLFPGCVDLLVYWLWRVFDTIHMILVNFVLWYFLSLSLRPSPRWLRPASRHDASRHHQLCRVH